MGSFLTGEAIYLVQISPYNSQFSSSCYFPGPILSLMSHLILLVESTVRFVPEEHNRAHSPRGHGLLSGKSWWVAVSCDLHCNRINQCRFLTGITAKGF